MVLRADDVRRVLFGLWLSGVLAGASGAAWDSAAAEPRWDVIWHLRDQFGVGHGGQTMFLVPDGSGGIWTNSTDVSRSQLWHLGSDGPSSPLEVRGESRSGNQSRNPALRRAALRGLLDAACTPDGHLWVASSEGLFEVDGTSTILHAGVRPATGLGSFHLIMGDAPALSTRPTALVTVDGYGEVWAYGSRMGLLRRTKTDATGRHGVWLAGTHYVPGRGLGLADTLDGDEVTAIASPIRGEVIIGTASGQLLFFKQEAYSTGTCVTLTQPVPPAVPRMGPVNDIIRDAQGRLWCAYGGAYIGDGDFGGAVARLSGGKWRVWNSENSRLPARPIMSVCEVDLGVIWAGADWHDPYVGGDPPKTTGLLQLAGDEWEYLNPPSFWDDPHPVAGKQPRIYNECTRRVCLIRTDDRGRVWVGSHGGLACFTAL